METLKKLKRLLQLARECPLRTLLIVLLGCGSLLAAVNFLDYCLEGIEGIFLDILVFYAMALFFLWPVVLSIYSLVELVLPGATDKGRRRTRALELLTICFGAVCFWAWSDVATEVCWDRDWWEQLYNAQLHTPIATDTQITFYILAAVGLAGYLLLYPARSRPMPPLVVVLGLAGLYLGAGLSVVLLIQVSRDWVLCVYPANLLLICARTVKELVLIHQKSPKEYRFPWLNKLLHRGASLPLLGLLAALPLLGILLGVLTLFGQAPDSIIRAWTQTSDWTFSQQIAPPNIQDGHYLCTVAAGGHRRLVKPLRMGKRHGHRVIVNRQLAVANAFEELLSQHLPRLHRLVRYVYDRWGYPISRHIRTPWAADAVWLLMKPAEWFFLVCLYLFDLNPENRIAVQYPHAPIPTEKDFVGK